MPQYRVEVCSNNRAGCMDTVCKKTGTKITKGEIRLGTWVEIQERGSWKWKHWGCVSGQQLEHVQEMCINGDSVNMDALDGYDEIEDEDVKEKIQRCVKQGHIDPEDFNGDPGYNKPSMKGIRGRATTKKKVDEAIEEKEKEKEEEEEQPKKTKGKKSDTVDPPKKRGRPSNASKAAAGASKDTASASKKRGRPRKSDAAASTEDEKPAEKLAARGRGRPRKSVDPPKSKEETEEEEADEEEKEVIKAPARRGRPKKEKEDMEKKEDKTALPKRGRPSKVDLEARAAAEAEAAADADVSTVEEKTTTAKKPRGKRVSTAAASTSPLSNDASPSMTPEEILKPPVKRGRPRKSDVATEIDSDKPKRGRPRKSVDQDALLQEIVAKEEKEKRGRGRPRKSEMQKEEDKRVKRKNMEEATAAVEAEGPKKRTRRSLQG